MKAVRCCSIAIKDVDLPFPTNQWTTAAGWSDLWFWSAPWISLNNITVKGGAAIFKSTKLRSHMKFSRHIDILTKKLSKRNNIEESWNLIECLSLQIWSYLISSASQKGPCHGFNKILMNLGIQEAIFSIGYHLYYI